MHTLITGFIGFLAVILYSMADAKASTFLNAHSIILVFAGTIAVFLMTSPSTEVKAVFKTFMGLFRNRKDTDELRKVLLELSKDKLNGAGADKHELIALAVSLWQKGIDHELFRLLMRQKLEELNRKTETSVAILRNLAKYPPALGMTGTVVGLVSVFSQLGSESRDNVGPSLALALTATFYGLIMANAVIMPLSDRMIVAHLFDAKVNEDTLAIILLINDGEPVHDLLKPGGV